MNDQDSVGPAHNQRRNRNAKYFTTSNESNDNSTRAHHTSIITESRPANESCIMRSSLSCNACRCAKSGLAAVCVLTRPRMSVGKAPRSRRTTPLESARCRDDGHADAARVQGRAPTALREHAGEPVAKAGSGREQESGHDLDAVDHHLANLPGSVLVKAVHVFTNSFPELAVLHLPTLLDELRCGRSPESKALLGAVLAVTKAQLSVLAAPWADGLLGRERYASYVKEALSSFILKPPKIQVVQALLVITLHEWGSRDFHKAWMYCGIAIRIMQALHSLRVAPYPLDLAPEHQHDGVSLAIETRAFWACFIMDCMVNSGTYNPPMLPMSEMAKLKVARPPTAVEFAFGPDTPPRAVGGHHCLAGQTTGMLDVTQSFEILVGGFDIWTQVMTFIFNDGRRAPGMCAPHNCPWVPGSPWSLSRNQLEAWRAGQHRKLHYPDNSVAIHMTLGVGETFVYLNLLYYFSTLMLHREYFPFLPMLESEPRGPVDHPRLEAEAPPGWWEESARLLFGAAESMARILSEASECGVRLMTPFVGFCAFSAGYINIYVFRFPRMNLGRSPDAGACANMCLDYLEEFRHVWKIADGWRASLLYERASNDGQRYRGRTRADFDTLHQSIHEFRVVDRSGEHNREIDGAERAAASTAQAAADAGMTTPPIQGLDTNTLLNQLMAEVSSNLDEQGAWSQWWPPIEQVDSQTGQ
ncbi:fungal specific transcription factor [Drechmeria coniospora]|uniref:Fungal specific transcription factor n=1 Tax=Drechmeria coniospora TaxID=98403 RepID=A0A151GJW4_DRECN|nr:fungal specific transcription factor [Drechmeria coniospora]KYK57302.1 fungal specific transcription factor [Drechmeria coniospora]